MAEMLPSPLNVYFTDQIRSVTQAIEERDKAALEAIRNEVGDLRLYILNLQFDLVATRRERDEALGE